MNIYFRVFEGEYTRLMTDSLLDVFSWLSNNYHLFVLDVRCQVWDDDSITYEIIVEERSI